MARLLEEGKFGQSDKQHANKHLSEKTGEGQGSESQSGGRQSGQTTEKQQGSESQSSGRQSGQTNGHQQGGQQSHGAGEKAGRMAEEGMQHVKQKADELQGNVEEYTREAEKYIRSNPIKSTFIAAVIGVVIGKLLK